MAIQYLVQLSVTNLRNQVGFLIIHTGVTGKNISLSNDDFFRKCFGENILMASYHMNSCRYLRIINK